MQDNRIPVTKVPKVVDKLTLGALVHLCCFLAP
jgi:hypothetical protein